MKKSMDSRLAYAREHNESPAQLMLVNRLQMRAVEPEVNAPVKKVVRKPKPLTDARVHQEQENLVIQGCICERRSQVVECRKCKMLFYGRIAVICPVHENVSYLFDFYCCPSCACGKEYLQNKIANN